MAGTILFYRGMSEATLPAIKDGSIFVIASDEIKNLNGQTEYYGDMYVDVSDTDRLHIRPNDAVYVVENDALSTETGLGDFIPPRGKVYIISDYSTEGDHAVPAVVVGDGVTSFKELPTYSVLTDNTLNKIESKVNVAAELIEGTTQDYQINFTTN